MRTIIIITSLVLISLISCNKEQATQPDNFLMKIINDTNWVEVTDTIPILIDCLDFDKMYNLFNIVVRTKQEYDDLIDTLRSRIKAKDYICDNYEFPEIDFDKYSLIGLETRTGPCEIKKKLFRNDSKKEFLYILVISETINENHLILITNRNTLLVPKIPSDYIVKMDTIMRIRY